MPRLHSNSVPRHARIRDRNVVVELHDRRRIVVISHDVARIVADDEIPIFQPQVVIGVSESEGGKRSLSCIDVSHSMNHIAEVAANFRGINQRSS